MQEGVGSTKDGPDGFIQSYSNVKNSMPFTEGSQHVGKSSEEICSYNVNYYDESSKPPPPKYSDVFEPLNKENINDANKKVKEDSTTGEEEYPVSCCSIGLCSCRFKPPIPLKTPKRKWKRVLIVGFLLITAQFLLAGYSVISVKYVKEEKIDVGLVTLFRNIVATTLALLMAMLFEGSFSLFKYNWKTLIILVVFGLLSSSLNPIMYLEVIKLTNGPYTTIIGQLIPILSSIFSIALKIEPLPSLKHKRTILRIIGIIIGVSSAVTITALNFVNVEEIIRNKWIYGTLLGIVNNTTFSLYLVLQLKFIFLNENSPLKNKPFTVNFLFLFYGSLIYIPCSTIYFIVMRKNITIRPIIVLPSLYAGICNSAIGFGFMTYAIKFGSAIISSSLFSLQVASSLILLRIFSSNETLTVAQYIICVGVFIGAFMVIFSPLLKEKKEHNTPTELPNSNSN